MSIIIWTLIFIAFFVMVFVFRFIPWSILCIIMLFITKNNDIALLGIAFIAVKYLIIFTVSAIFAKQNKSITSNPSVMLMSIIFQIVEIVYIGCSIYHLYLYYN